MPDPTTPMEPDEKANGSHAGTSLTNALSTKIDELVSIDALSTKIDALSTKIDELVSIDDQRKIF